MRQKDACWRDMLTEHMHGYGESLADVVSNTMSDADMDKAFYCGWGTSEGVPFTVWTTNRVYFPVVYDGAEWVGSVPRHPNGEATDHVGGQ